MITRRTKVQLLVFVLITLLGVSYVGARYARLDRLVVDDSYTVVAHLPESGGIFTGAEVSYRGVEVGKVAQLKLTDRGVDAYLDVQNDFDSIPSDSLAVVGNRSAVGEQYVELQPQTNSGPYLEDASQIQPDDTRTPIPTQVLLTHLNDTVESVDKPALKTTVGELGKAFAGTGPDLQRIIDTGNSFIHLANQNFDTTSALIRDSNTVLKGQIASTGAIKTFARDMALFSTTLAGSDADLREVIDSGSVTADQLRTFLEDNRVDLAQLINNLVTTGDVVVKHLPGVQQLLIIYPYVVEGGFTVVSKSPDSGLYDAHFGMILTQDPAACTRGYHDSQVRSPQQRGDKPMDTTARCAEPPSQSNARGAQNVRRAPAAYRAPVVASYDPGTRHLTWGDKVDPDLSSPGGQAPATLGQESWKWLYLQPLTSTQQ